jgi:hypothetical protein
VIRVAVLLGVVLTLFVAKSAIAPSSASALVGSPVDITQAVTDVASGDATPMEWEEFQATIDWLASESGVSDANIPYPEIPAFGGYTGDATNWGLDPDVEALMSADASAAETGSVANAVGGDIVGAEVFEGFMPAMSTVLPVIGTVGAAGATFYAGWEIGGVIRHAVFPDPGLDAVSPTAQFEPEVPTGSRVAWFSVPGCGQYYPGQFDPDIGATCTPGQGDVTGDCDNNYIPSEVGISDMNDLPCNLPHGPTEHPGFYALELKSQYTNGWVADYPVLSTLSPSLGPCAGQNPTGRYFGTPPDGKDGYKTIWGGGAGAQGGPGFFCYSPGADDFHNGPEVDVSQISLTYKASRSLHNSMPRRGQSCSDCTQVDPASPSGFATAQGPQAAAGVIRDYLNAGSGGIHEPLAQYINANLNGTKSQSDPTPTHVTDPTTNAPTAEPGLVTVPASCIGEQPAQCKADLSAAGFTTAPAETTLTPAQSDLTKPAGSVVETKPAVGTQVDTATSVELDENPNPLPLTIPAPDPGETYPNYIARLQQLGFTGTITNTFLDDQQLDTTQGPDVAIRTNPAVGTQVTPETSIEVFSNPDDAPQPADGGAGAGGGPLAPDLPGINIPTASTPCTVFPFGLPCWIGGALSQLASVAPQAPSWSISTPQVLGGTPLNIDLGNIFGFDFSSVMGVVRPVLLFLSLIGLVVWAVGLAMGGSTGGGGGGAESEE